MNTYGADNLSGIPQTVSTPALPLGKLPFGFGRRFFLALALGTLWLVPAWTMHSFIAAMFLWDALVCAAWLWDFLRLCRPDQLTVTRSWRMRPALAVASKVYVQVAAQSSLPLYIRALDEVPPALSIEQPALEFELPAVGSLERSYSILPRERGRITLGRVFLRYQSALQFAERRAVADLRQTVRVLPNIEEARRQTLRLIRGRYAEMDRRRHRQRGMGRELDGLRDYREGDEFRNVAWSATARRHRLITRVFQMERSQTVWLVLDAGRLLRARVQEPGSSLQLSKLDHAVNAALCLAQVAMHSGDKVGLLAYGSRVQQNLAPNRGASFVRRFADSLAEIHSEAQEPDHTGAVRELLREQKRRSLIVWITDFAETATVPEVVESAMQMNPRHLVLFVAMNQPELTELAAAIPNSQEDMYRHAAALEVSQRRDVLLRRLRQRGILAFEWAPWGLTTLLVNQYLDLKERNRL